MNMITNKCCILACTAPVSYLVIFIIIFGLKMESNTSGGTPLILRGALPAPWQGMEVILFWKLLNAL